jgi:hypothetical protein
MSRFEIEHAMSAAMAWGILGNDTMTFVDVNVGKNAK